ncbi:MAG: trypsin-like peptidase domain-containing protein [Nanohaloarchaea archaeon]|nr:trypsin-like peptidase domain-containing protein [Candidatus Nanohaloarchaea archaeon]
MNKIKAALAALSLITLGVVLGGTASFVQLQGQIDQLNSSIQDRETRVVSVQYSGERAVSEIFDSADQSVVSIAAFGEQDSQGSGFVYSKNGYIVTNHHVVDGASQIEVTFTDGSTKNARIVGSDPYTDLAVLKVKKEGLRPLELADSSNVTVGRKAIAIGNPFGLRSSVTLGIISQKGRTLRTSEEFSTPNVLQTDAAINPGNSGGPLMNINGDVVGVNTAIESRTGTFSGVGFAIPSNTVKTVVPEIIAEGDYEHPWIGVSGFDLTPELSRRMGLNTTSGFLVIDVVDDGPAAKAGVLEGGTTIDYRGRKLDIGGDVIVGIGDQKARGINDILLYLSRQTEVGDTVNLEIIRDGERKTVSLTLDQRPEANVLD